MRLLIGIEDDGPHTLTVEEAGQEFMEALWARREENPNAPVSLGGSLDGGHPQMWFSRSGAITGMEVEQG